MKSAALLAAILGFAMFLPAFSADDKKDTPKGKDEAALTQAQAIEQIEKRGGKVVIDKKSPGQPVIEVIFPRKKIVDEDLTACKGFTHLKNLHLADTHASDKALLLMSIRDKTELESLMLEFTDVTDASLKEVENATNLQSLYAGGVTGITDKGLGYLEKCSKLKKLVLFGNRNITDVGLKNISGLTKLEVLNLRGSRITDEGLKELKGMTNLRRLILWDTAITDAGLEHLKVLTKLELVYLKNTKTTEKGIAELKKVLPKADISK